MKAYSPEMRRDVLDMTAAGMSTREIRNELEVSESWIRRVKQEFRETGKAAPATTRKRIPHWQQHADWLRSKLAENSDLYLRELVALASAERGWKSSITQMFCAVKALGLTRKKRR